jgi:hypothetical protein
MSIRETVIDVVSEIVSVVAPDGSTVATNNGGRLTLQVATNNQFGIVKGQANDSPTTWHNASIVNGIPSVNRGQVESVMDSNHRQDIKTAGGGAAVRQGFGANSWSSKGRSPANSYSGSRTGRHSLSERTPSAVHGQARRKLTTKGGAL